ncbi:MAG: SRPBCC family protein [Actinomycetota bacterium]|nr:SRPBCC family protein [Actinomycetota bacterium]
MPTNLTVAAGVVVDAAPDRLWELAVDWSRQSEWIWATRVDGGHEAGATVVGWTGIGPVGFTDTMVITEWDPPRRCTVTHVGKVVRGTGIFEVVPRGARAEFRWTERIQLPLPPLLGRPAALVAGPVARIALESSLRRFARLAQRNTA